eukprot:2661911-Rhodomonas_salina.1
MQTGRAPSLAPCYLVAECLVAPQTISASGIEHQVRRQADTGLHTWNPRRSVLYRTDVCLSNQPPHAHESIHTVFGLNMACRTVVRTPVVLLLCVLSLFSASSSKSSVASSASSITFATVPCNGLTEISCASRFGSMLTIDGSSSQPTLPIDLSSIGSA